MRQVLNFILLNKKNSTVFALVLNLVQSDNHEIVLVLVQPYIQVYNDTISGNKLFGELFH